ncbi:hypothetical protein JCM11641_001453 [Rhodosporidiobolus odoratus]
MLAVGRALALLSLLTLYLSRPSPHFLDHPSRHSSTRLLASLPPSPPRARRLPAPPLRGSAFAAEQAGSCPTSGIKRERERTESDQGVDERGDDDEAAIDRPRKKRRKGVLGTAVSTALDAAIFASAVAYSAYRLWKHPLTSEDLEAHLRLKRLTAEPEGAAPLPQAAIEAPPPYSESASRQPSSHTSSNPATASPSHIPRRLRHVHEPRPRTTSRSSFTRPPPIATSTESHGGFDPFASLARDPLPEFQPYNSPRRSVLSPASESAGFSPALGVVENEEEELSDLDEDDEMRAVGEQLRTLIESGREALVARPKEWDALRAPEQEEHEELALRPPTFPSPSSYRSRMSTGDSTSTFASSAASSSLSRTTARNALASGGQQSLPSFARPTISSITVSPSSPSTSHRLHLSPQAPRSPRLSTSATTTRNRRASVDPLSPSFPSASPGRFPPHSPTSARRTSIQSAGQPYSMQLSYGGSSANAEALEGSQQRRKSRVAQDERRGSSGGLGIGGLH